MSAIFISSIKISVSSFMISKPCLLSTFSNSNVWMPVFLFRTICPSSTVFMSQPNSSNSLNTVDLHLSHTIFFKLRVCFIILFIVPEMGRAINQPTSISFPYQGIILMFLLGSSYNQ